jgi:hypothetical protein
MYSCLVAKIFGEEKYDWFRYGGKPLEVPFRGITRTLEKGQRFGVRKSSNGKQIRMVFDGDITRVMTIDLNLAKKIAKGIVKGK